MSAPALTEAAPTGPGFHGKMPANGDFVARRLPRSFVDPWHGWLEDGLEASRNTLGPGWLDLYLNAPVWRFALSGGACGADAVAGVMIPSVDKVGRYFPMVVARPLPEDTAPALLPLAAAEPWFAAAEALALSALDRATTVEGLERGLDGLPPLDVPAPVPGTVPEPDPLLGTRFAGRILESLNDDSGALYGGLVHGMLRRSSGQYTVWWTDGSDRVAAGMLVAAGMPEADAFASLLDGDWSRWSAAMPMPGASAADDGMDGFPPAAESSEWD
ncbi:type VI secretion system-associated protein TagF [Azospirillum sp. RWY-5-1]|uniref:Type VI secretion system-associated protein TagF n=1 Tax=Azospirillum oleiclasticum TaxID=2735135 RepID=A0ABX2T1L8_9PROT|nr:type VI secretion system-associated protein TagF [Azospirillum oleiclasticum]NYZ18210.1 type VI secretion system-associated protein TagF [Azospirillum oleiclasticum]